MPNQIDLVSIKKPRSDVLVLAGILGVGGIVLVLMGLGKKQPGDQFGPLNPLAPGEVMSDPMSPSLEIGGTFDVAPGSLVSASRPVVTYQGAGRDTFSYMRVVQWRNGVWVTVQGSGVAGVHIGPAEVQTTYDLVSPNEIQPPGCQPQSLCGFPWPGPGPTSGQICGAPPQAGFGHVLLEIYEMRNPSVDGIDGRASPTCNPRVAIRRKAYMNKVRYA